MAQGNTGVGEGETEASGESAEEIGEVAGAYGRGSSDDLAYIAVHHQSTPRTPQGRAK